MTSRQRGLTLTELLVATTLLAMATTGGLTALSRAHAARRDAGAVQQLHERAQYTFATLEPDLQMAGYFAGDTMHGPLETFAVPAAALRCGPAPVLSLHEPLQVIPEWSLPCEARGSGALDGSDVLIVRRLSARTAPRPEAGRAQWLTRSSSPGKGQLFWIGEAPSASEAAGDQLRDLMVRIYYVSRSSDGDDTTPALRVKSLTSIAGTAAFIDTEVMHGIEGLHVELLPTPTAPHAARVRLRVRADAAALRAGGSPFAVEVVRHFALRNA